MVSRNKVHNCSRENSVVGCVSRSPGLDFTKYFLAKAKMTGPTLEPLGEEFWLLLLQTPA